MPFENLPGIFKEEQDGNLVVQVINDNPIVLVLGTASQGESESVFIVDRVNDAARAFGNLGTLTRGLFETSIGLASTVPRRVR